MNETLDTSETQPVADVTIVLESTGDTPGQILSTTKRILNTAHSIGKESVQVIASIHIGSMVADYKRWTAEYDQIQLETPNLTILGVDEGNQWTHAYSYLFPIKTVAYNGSGQRIIVEMDGGGGHLPEEIPGFLFDPKKTSVALSTRFAKGGKNLATPQRKAVSYLGTLATNVLAIPPTFQYPWIWVTDGTSGFESFSAGIIRTLFNIVPIESFICVQKGAPFHLYQTEMRAYLLAILSASKKDGLIEIPITYGKEKKVSNLPPRYVLQSALQFPHIRKNVLAIFETLK